MKPELKFMIVAGDALARTGLAAYIETLPKSQVMSLVHPSELLDDLAAGFEDGGATITIWDWGLEDNDTSYLDFRETNIPVIALLADSDQVSDALDAGASALIKRSASGDEIYATSITVLRGLFVIDPDLVGAIRHPKAQRAADLEELPTPREREVLQLMAEGFTNRAIAQQLGISKHTVKFHVNSILSKLNAQSRTEAVVQATRLGFIAL